MSRHGPSTDRVTEARLCGTAARYAQDAAMDETAAVRELTEIATERRRGESPRLRVDLLSNAAGALLGSHRHSPTTYWSAHTAGQLLLAAGANVAATERAAEATQRRLAGSSRGGIGNPC